MPRTIDIALPAGKTDQLIEEVKKINGLIGLRVLRGASLKPEGDVLSLEITNKDLSTLMQLLSRFRMLTDGRVSITTNHPMCIISRSSQAKITSDNSEAIWEEMQATINKQSMMTLNNMLTMFLAGVIAVIGIVTNALHIVIGAMVVAPGFEPITRISLGVVSQHVDWRSGIRDTVRAYAALLSGAIVTAWVMQQVGEDLTKGDASYLPAGVLISYWTKITAYSLIINAAAAVLGALVIVTNRSILTAGVMIALALVPSTTMIGIGIVAGDWSVAGNGLLRLVTEIAIVTVFTGMIFTWKKYTVQRRRMYN